MSTINLIDVILNLSGPFTTEKAKSAHRRWLTMLTTETLERRRQALLQTSQRPAGQGTLKFSYSR